MTPEQRLAIVSKLKQDKNPSVYADTVKSVGSGLAKGAVDAVMVLPNILNEAAAGPQYLYEGLIGDDRKDFEPWQPFYGSEDVTRGSRIDYEPQTTVGKVANFPSRIMGNMVAPAAINKASKIAFKPPKGERASQQLKRQAQQKYDSVEQSGTKTADGFLDDLGYDAIALHPKGRVAQAANVSDAYDDALDAVLLQSSNKNLSIKEVKDLDTLLGNMAEEATKSGAASATSRKIKDLQQLVRNKTMGAAEKGLVKGDPKTVQDWRDAVSTYSKSMKAKEIENIISNGMRTDNPQTAIKTGIKNVLKRIEAGKARGWSPKEVAALEKAANQAEVTGLLRIVGSRLNPIMQASQGGLDAGITSAAVGKLARDQAVRNVRGAAEKAVDVIADMPKPAPTKFQTQQLANPVRGSAAAMVTDSLNQDNESSEPEIAPDIRELILQKLRERDSSSKPVNLEREAPQSSLLNRIKQAESSGDVNAKNPNTSASGLYQFTDSTWKGAVNKWGRKYGITHKDKDNPQAQEIMVTHLTDDNARILKAKGIEPTDGNLYFAHFMGAPAGAKAISMLGSGAIGAKSFPSAAKSNPTIFFKTDKRGKPIRNKPRTIDEVYKIMTDKVG